MSYHQTIYNRLRKFGFTEAGALGVLGNWEAESNCEPCRLQNDFSSTRTASKTYTERVETGGMTRRDFATDQKGYGLAQWTYFNFATGEGRKQDLYDFWKKRGGKLDDVNMQVDFALWEMTTYGQYASLLQILKTTDDIYTATDKVCRIFEQPYYCNVDSRVQNAREIAKELNLDGWQDDPAEPDKPDTDEDGMPIPKTWPPRTIDSHCSGWPEVWMLQSLLRCHGYNVLDDGIWGSVLTDKVKKFQRENGLEDDGVVGKNTYIKLGIDPAVFERR